MYTASAVCQLLWARSMCWPCRIAELAFVIFLPLLLLSNRSAAFVLLLAVGLWDVHGDVWSRRRCYARPAGRCAQVIGLSGKGGGGVMEHVAVLCEGRDRGAPGRD